MILMNGFMNAFLFRRKEVTFELKSLTFLCFFLTHLNLIFTFSSFLSFGQRSVVIFCTPTFFYANPFLTVKTLSDLFFIIFLQKPSYNVANFGWNFSYSFFFFFVFFKILSISSIDLISSAFFSLCGVYFSFPS